MFRNLLYSAFGVLGSREANALEKESLAPRDAQWARLHSIVRGNTETVYGKEHNFSSIKSIADFQAAVPVNSYEDLSPYVTRTSQGEQSVLTSEMPFMFATTSGTTGARKLIPITRSYVKEFRRASVASGYHLLRTFPAVANGIALSVFSRAQEGLTPAGIPYGAITGRLYLEEPPLIKKYVTPIPYEVFLVDDYESRYYTLLRVALVLPVSTFYTLNPSTILALARRLKTYGPQLIKDIREGSLRPPCELPKEVACSVRKFLSPNPIRARELESLLEADRFTPDQVWKTLALVSCWTKAAAAFYLEDLPPYFGQVPICDITYGASEGRGTVSISRSEQMLAIRSHFFEFIPEDDPKALPLLADQVTPGESYSILFTTSGGLYRYDINDIVKVVGWHNRTPLLEFRHKKGNVSSFTGEKLTESQVTDAVIRASKELKIKLAFFTVVPEFRPEPHYQLWVEPAFDFPWDDYKDASRLRAAFDEELARANIEYDAKRKSKRLAEPLLKILPKGAYETLRKSLVKSGVPDAQVKVSHLNPKAEVKASLAEAVKQLVSPGTI